MRSLELEPSEMQLQKMIDEVDTDGLQVKSDSGGEMTILAGTIDFLDFCTMVRKMNDDFSEDDLKKSFLKLADVLDLLRCLMEGTVDHVMLGNAILEYLRANLRAYGLIAWIPKTPPCGALSKVLEILAC